MCGLFSFGLFPISPVPTSKRFILGSTDNLINGTAIKYSNCMLVIRIFRYLLSGRNIPYNGLTIPRTRYKMLIINKINWWNRTIMFKDRKRITRMIKSINFTICTTYKNKYLSRLISINFDGKQVLLKYRYSCYLLNFFIFDRIQFYKLITSTCN